MNELNKRQVELYEFLKTASIRKPNEWIDKDFICNALYEYYPRMDELSSEHNSTAYLTIRKDVRTINFSRVEKLIVSSNKGYKIATEEEAKIYLARRLRKSLTSLKLYWGMKAKAEHNKQIDIDLNEIKTFVGEK